MTRARALGRIPRDAAHAATEGSTRGVGAAARRARATGVTIALLAAAVATSTSGCGGCPRSRGAGAFGSHPSATEVPAGAPIVVEATAGPPLPVELDEATVHAVAASQAIDLRHCFEVARAEHPALSGRVDLELSIGADGAVRGAAVAMNETGDGVLSACLVALAERWHFPSSPHGARVTVPLTAADPPPPPQPEGAAAEATEVTATGSPAARTIGVE